MIDYGSLLDVAADKIRTCLPADREIDDVSWGDNGFRICIYDVSVFPCRYVDALVFSGIDGESQDETLDRFYFEVDEYIRKWRKCK